MARAYTHKPPVLTKRAYKGMRPLITAWSQRLRDGEDEYGDVPSEAVTGLMQHASDPHAPRRVLDFLLKSPNVSVRVALAANPRLPRQHFIVLLADRSSDVVEAAIANQAVPYDLLLATAERHPDRAARALATSILDEFTPGGVA